MSEGLSKANHNTIAIGAHNLYPTSYSTNYFYYLYLASTTKGETDIDPKKGTSKLSSALRADCYSSACTSDNALQHKVTNKVNYLPPQFNRSGLDTTTLN